MDQANIAIAGGGIGGLTAALCLAKLGNHVQLFEQAQAFSEAGAGLQLSPNCSRVLHYLGLEAALKATAFLPTHTQFRHWRSGRVIAETTLGEQALTQYGAPYYHMHRGDLLQVLVDAVTADSNITIHTNAPVSGFHEEDGVTIQAGGQDYRVDLLVGADGIHSKVREVLWGAEKASFTGNIAWRALVPVESLPKDLIRPMSTAWWGPHKHFVHYYVRGGQWVNCVCVVEKQGWEVESWTEQGDIHELRGDFTGWHSDIQQLIDHMQADSLYKWALFDRAPMARWGRGAVTLLGDACHPTLPFMAQGAAMAIEDAAVLSLALQASDSVDDGLRIYEELRRTRTARIQSGSRRNAKVFHMSGIPAWIRNRGAKAAGNKSMASLYGYDPLQAVDKA